MTGPPAGVDPATGEITRACRRGTPHPDAPKLNARGKPWTAVGRRNMSAGNGLGNGGVIPPHGYERHTEPLGPCEHNDAYTMHDWRIVVGAAVRFGWVTRSVSQMLQDGLASFADPSGRHVWPSQAAIGERCDLSEGRVNHLLAQARRAGLIARTRRSEVVAAGTICATSNTYEFCFPFELLKALQMTARLRKERAKHLRRRPNKHTKDEHTRNKRAVEQKRVNERRKMTPVEFERRERQSALAAEANAIALTHHQFEDARAALETRLHGAAPDDVAFAVDELERRWKTRAPD